ncbi:MAG: DNA repair protein RadC [Candidatus Diapherotrites archaeon]|nr:DNA repair protein RadC [Candidatus Diapherotrites archaeon]
MGVLDLPSGDRPRERLLRLGPESLSDAELLAILMNSGTRGSDVISLSQSLLKDLGVPALARASVTELLGFRGIGLAKACRIVACFELSKRSAEGHTPSRFACAADAARLLMPRMHSMKKECFVGLYLDSKARLLRREVLSIGSLNASVIHPREVFRPALVEHAAAVIVAHNHPSGDATPSSEDVALTKQLCAAAEVLGIVFVDHLVVGNGSYYSMREHGVI